MKWSDYTVIAYENLSVYNENVIGEFSLSENESISPEVSEYLNSYLDFHSGITDPEGWINVTFNGGYGIVNLSVKFCSWDLIPKNEYYYFEWNLSKGSISQSLFLNRSILKNNLENGSNIIEIKIRLLDFDPCDDVEAYLYFDLFLTILYLT